MPDSTDKIEDAQEAIAEVGDAIEEARQEAIEEITDVAEQVAVTTRLDAIEAQLASVAGRADPSEALAGIAARLDAMEQGAEGSTADALADARDVADAAAEEIEGSTDVLDVMPDAVEEAVTDVETATEVEEAPRRAHLLFRKIGLGGRD